MRPPAQGRKGPRLLDIDLGAIGKGYALDSALGILRDWGIKNALIHAGTSTALGIGPGPGLEAESPGWPVGVASAWECRGTPRMIRLRERALSGSGTEVKGEHINDPRTGGAARGHLAAWVCHSSAAVSDALSTAFMVMRTEEVAAYCRRHRDVWSLVILDEKKCRIFNAKTVA
jgi:thiamine biosynthesis lipoprotein